MARKDTQALKATIETVPQLATKTLLGRAPRDADGRLPTLPLALIHPSGGTDTVERLTGPRNTRHPRFTVHLVGSSVDAVEIMRDAVKAKFHANGFGVAPPVPGERTYGFLWSESVPIQWDTDVAGSPVAYAVVEIEWTSDPA